MQIYWHGYSSVRIEASLNQQDVSLVTDPFENEGAVRFPRTLSPDMLVLSHQDRSKFPMDSIQGTPFVVSEPGEYEVKGMYVQGVQDVKQGEGEKLRPMIYRIVAEGMTVAFLGQLNRKLSEYEIEQLGDVDILLLPVGGGEVMGSKLASETISLIEPRVVVPMYHDIPGLKAKLEHVDAFCKAVGVCQRQDSTKLKISKKDLPAEDLLVAVLERA